MGLLSGIGKAVKSVVGSVTGGDVLGLAGGLLGNASANSAAASSAASANAMTKEMMQKRHQWEVDDLKAAGLNPILSAGGTPSMGSSAKAEVFNPVDSAVKSVSSSQAARRLSAEIDQIKANTRAADASANNSNASAMANSASAAQTLQHTKIKQPLADMMMGASDVTSSALSNFRNMGDLVTGKRSLRRVYPKGDSPSSSVWRRLTD